MTRAGRSEEASTQPIEGGEPEPAGDPSDFTLDGQVNQPWDGISGVGVCVSAGHTLRRLDTNTGTVLTSHLMENTGEGTIVGPQGVVSVGLTTAAGGVSPKSKQRSYPAHVPIRAEMRYP